MRKIVAAGAKPFDATTKELVESGPADWVRLLGLPADQARVIDADLATISTEADRVILVTAPYSYIVHLEFQSGHDGADVPERLLRYNVLLSYRHRLPVRSAVILLRRQADSPVLTGELTRALPDSETYLKFEYDVFRIWKQKTSDLLSGGLSLLPLAPLTADPEQIEDVVREMEARIESEARPREARRLWASSYILMGLRFPAKFIADALRGVQQMKESTTYQAILREGRKEGLSVGKAEGLSVGKAEGIAIGKEEGRAEGERALILRVGRKRFGEPSAIIEEQVLSINALAQLETLADRLLEVETWDELLQR